MIIQEDLLVDCEAVLNISALLLKKKGRMPWNHGMPNAGMLECQECQNAGMLECWNARMPECQNARMLWNAGMPECQPSLCINY